MPKVLEVGPYRFFVYPYDRVEPMHIHVERDDMTAKFWLDPVRLAHNSGFKRPELRRIERLVTKNREFFITWWHGYFNESN